MSLWRVVGGSSSGGNSSTVKFQTESGVLSYNAAAVGVNLGGKTIYSALVNGSESYLTGHMGINGSGTVTFDSDPGVALCSISYAA